ncbi:PGF-pre-PGF domain-containing protein [Methanolobus sp. ZRKC3]|uniref:DUF5018 domain-containing protein n=1 Tax=Methanolobus sp. ZRKC3 TaxID=3125786 RepID=UPI003249FE00
MQKRIFFILMILTIFSVSGMTASADNSHSNDGNKIFLKAGEIDTGTALDNTETEAQITTSSATAFSDTEEEFYIVQFTGPVLPEWKDEIEEAGATISDYIPSNAFVIRMSQSEKEQVNSLEFIQWIGDFKPAYKVAPGITESESQIHSVSANMFADLIVVLFDPKDNARIIAEINSIGGNVPQESETSLRVKIPENRINELTTINGICWIEKYSEPVLSNDVSATIMNVNPVHNNYSLKGNGQIIAISDTGLDTGIDDSSMHADISGRIVDIIDYSDNGAADFNGHGTHVTGSVLGNGAMSGGQYKGIAPEASLVFQGLQNANQNYSMPLDLADLFQDAYGKGARIHTNSWSYANYDGLYTIRSHQVDEFAWNQQDMLILFSAGNFGEDADYNGVVDPDSITPPATSKNCIAVGASENYRGTTFGIGSYTRWGVRWPSDFPINPLKEDYIADDIDGIAAFSSRGPTDDGRIKPDLVAPGTFVASTRSNQLNSWYDWGGIDPYYAYSGGTSMSTPLVAGSAILIREYYTDIEQFENPSAALLKATLINGAHDMTPGQYGTADTQEIHGRPDYSQGWGLVDVENSLFPEYPKVVTYVDWQSLDMFDSWNVSYGIFKGSEPVRSTLVWTDFPGAPYATKTLVNDLDLKLSGPNETYYGNGGIEPDRTNNVEGVEIRDPASGNYTITVDGYNVQHGPQNFSLVLSFTCDNNNFPENNSHISNNATIVSTDIVHPAGVNMSSVVMRIDNSPVTFTSTSIPHGHHIEYSTPQAYASGKHDVSITASTDKGTEFAYDWEFNVRAKITSFRFEGIAPIVNGLINETEKKVNLTVPYGTDVTALVPSIAHTGASISPNTGAAQDFTNPVTYTLTAEDATTKEYIVTVDVEPNTAKEIISFRFEGLETIVNGAVDEAAKMVSLTVPYGTNLKALVPAITHTGESITPNTGVTQDFTNPVIYMVTAEDGTTKEYRVTVDVALNTAKEITSFRFEQLDTVVFGEVNEIEKKVSLAVPYGTDVTALVPTIAHTGESIAPNTGVVQDFTNPVTYMVAAEDATTQNYIVTVAVAPNTTKKITSFSFEGLEPIVNGVVDEGEKKISLAVPHGTDVTTLVPTIGHTGASISPNTEMAQDFTEPVTYRVKAEDATTQKYVVTVNIAPNPAKAITSFKFAGLEQIVFGVVDEGEKKVSLAVPHGTDVTALIPTIDHTGASISPNTWMPQDFTDPVTYKVKAEDATIQKYIVTVNIAPNPAKAITSFEFTGLDPLVTGTIDEGAKAVTITVPYGTNVTALVPAIKHTGESITPNTGVAQDFTDPLAYTVTAEDASIQEYIVTVSVAPNTVKAITSFKFTGLEPVVTGVIDEEAKMINLTVPFGTNVTALVPTIAYNGASISPNTGVPQNFTNPINYTVTAEDATTQNYIVTVNIAPNTNTISTPTSSSGGGGGGGGGGNTGEEFENIAFKDVSTIFVGKIAIEFSFNDNSNDIRYIRYESLKNAGKISTTIEVLKNTSAIANKKPEGIIYKNVNIWVGKTGYATEKNIGDPVIGFRIHKRWIEENRIDTQSITLNRFNAGSWQRLETRNTDSDDMYMYFEAQTPGFSPFAITGEKLEEESDKSSGKLFSDIELEIADQSEINPPAANVEKSIPGFSGIFACMVISIAFFLIRRR